MLERGDFEALVVGNDGERFSIGFNVMLGALSQYKLFFIEWNANISYFFAVILLMLFKR